MASSSSPAQPATILDGGFTDCVDRATGTKRKHVAENDDRLEALQEADEKPSLNRSRILRQGKPINIWPPVGTFIGAGEIVAIWTSGKGDEDPRVPQPIVMWRVRYEDGHYEEFDEDDMTSAVLCMNEDEVIRSHSLIGNSLHDVSAVAETRRMIENSQIPAFQLGRMIENSRTGGGMSASMSASYGPGDLPGVDDRNEDECLACRKLFCGYHNGGEVHTCKAGSDGRLEATRRDEAHRLLEATRRKMDDDAYYEEYKILVEEELEDKTKTSKAGDKACDTEPAQAPVTPETVTYFAGACAEPAYKHPESYVIPNIDPESYAASPPAIGESCPISPRRQALNESGQSGSPVHVFKCL